MPVRHILGVAICCGTIGALGGQSARAQPTNPLGFVQMLLLRESRQIRVDTRAIARQDPEVRLLDHFKAIAPRTARQASRLQGEIAVLQLNIVLLQARIDSTTSRLLSLERKLGAILASLGNPSPFAQQAAANAAIIARLAARPPYGIPPATATQ